MNSPTHSSQGGAPLNLFQGSRPPRVHLAGVSFDRYSETELVAEVLDRVNEGIGGHLVTPNVSIVRLSQRDDIKVIVQSADFVACDGMPLVWASRLAGTPLPERIAGSSLIWTLSQEAAAQGRSIYLLGGSTGADMAASRRLVARNPALRVAGTHSPPFGFESDDAQLADMTRRLVAAAPDIVFVGLGFPKQELLIRQLRNVLPQAWFVGCGAAINFAAGLQKRAPRWMQSAGLEWLHRLWAEPSRLGGRYASDAVFALRLLARSAAVRVYIRANRSTRAALSTPRAGSKAQAAPNVGSRPQSRQARGPWRRPQRLE